MWFGLMRKKKTEEKETKNPQRFRGKAYKINKGKSEELFLEIRVEGVCPRGKFKCMS